MTRKALILTLALWTGIANFAYASARLECAAMMQNMGMAPAGRMDAEHACCPKAVPCQCSIKTRSNDLSVPAHAHFGHSNEISPSAVLSETPAVSAPVRFERRAGDSPPGGPPLYALFSAYRI
jgi:hypothetical protein